MTQTDTFFFTRRAEIHVFNNSIEFYYTEHVVFYYLLTRQITNNIFSLFLLQQFLHVDYVLKITTTYCL